MMRAAVLACALLGACVGPFHRGTRDTRPDLAVADVTDDGLVRLTDGRTVRLFAVALPADHVLVDHLRDELRGARVSVEEIVPGEPPAVELTVWEKQRYCGLALSTWNPFAGPLDGAIGSDVVANLPRGFRVLESDLEHPAAPPRLVRAVRARQGSR